MNYPPQLYRQIGDHKIHDGVVEHIFRNYPEHTVISAECNGWVNTLETRENGNRYNIWLNTYNVDLTRYHLNIDMNNFNREFIILVNQGYLIPVCSEKLY